MTDAVERLHHAIASKDNKGIIKVIADYDNEKLQEIAAEYVKQYSTPLTEAVKPIAPTNDFLLLLDDLIIPRATFAAKTIHNAITGAGTDEDAIIDSIVHVSKHHIDQIKLKYAEIFNQNLADKIASDLSGHFKKAVAAILEHGRAGSFGNPEAEAEALYKKGEGVWGTDDDYFVNFFTHHSFESLQAVDQAYKAKYGHSLEVAIKKETSGAYKDILVALSVPREVYWARRIHHAVSGLGTNDTLLRRAFTLNTKDDLYRIDAVYQEATGSKRESLRQAVADDTSGFYKELFLAVLDQARK